MKVLDPFRRQYKLAWLLVTLILASTAKVYPVPIIYSMVVKARPSGAGPSGKLVGANGATVWFGGSSGNVVLSFTLPGDIANVVPWSIPAQGGNQLTGYEILIGTASFQNEGVVFDESVIGERLRSAGS